LPQLTDGVFRPVIISRTPYRLSFFGGGTDYPKWYLKHGGAVIGTAIDKYCNISLRRLPPFFEHRYRVVWSRIELVNDLLEIEHPAVRAVLLDQKERRGLEIHHDGDLPARSGLGSSSAFTVGLLNALYALRGQMISKQKLAEEAIRIEQHVIREPVGSQDQIWAAFGGLNRIDFRTDGTFTVKPLILTPSRRQELESSLMLFFTGLSRYALTVASKQIANMDAKERNLHRMREMVDEAEAIIGDPLRPVLDLGALMHDAWRLKKELADGVSTPAIDAIYEAGIAAGAVGGKLLGAGGGGFVAFVAPPEKRQAIREKLKDLIEVDVKTGADGSRIVVYEPDLNE
jgi:D-glycero-alpha-D-manno-heptose-7-phosphate kinase